MKLKRLVLTVILATLALCSWAQVSADPNDYFYTDLAIWETMGLVNNLPSARPYPLQVVRKVLDAVIERGDATQRQIAGAHAARIFGRTLTWGGKSEATIDPASSGKALGLALAADINAGISPEITAGASVDLWATNRLPAKELLVEGQESARDIVEDNAKVGPFWVLPSINTSLAIGNPSLYLNAGLMRGSYGPFHSNGVIVGPQAMHAGQYSLAIDRGMWSYNQVLYGLSATSENRNSKGFYDFYPEKYLSVHSLDVHPFDWLSVSFLESVMFGERLEIQYLLPFAPYMISQGMVGFADNSYLGGMFTVKPVAGLRLDGVLYADDLSFNDIVRFNFDTKWRLAGQLGASWAPRSSGMFTLASLDYTMVTPYTYSHKESDALDPAQPNYINYLHTGQLYGAALQPNSDRLNVKLTLRPLEDVDFNLVGTLIRHGNVNEGIGDKWVREYVTNATVDYCTDGSVLNSSASSVGHAFNYSTPFLTQDTIQYVWQAGFDALCRLPVLKTGGYMVFKLGYRFECDMNGGINSEVYRYDVTATESTWAAVADAQLASWRAAAKGIAFNNYISAGFEYFF